MSVSKSCGGRAAATADTRPSPATLACDNFTVAKMRGPGKWSLGSRSRSRPARGRRRREPRARDRRASRFRGAAGRGPGSGLGPVHRRKWRSDAARGPRTRHRGDRTARVVRGRLRELRIAGDELRCERGRLAGALGSLGVQDSASPRAAAPDGRLGLDFDDFAIAGGRGAQGRNLVGARLAGRRATRREWTSPRPPTSRNPGPPSRGPRPLGHRRRRVPRDRARRRPAIRPAPSSSIETLDFSDAEGTLAGEKLAGAFSVDASPDAGRMRRGAS